MPLGPPAHSFPPTRSASPRDRHLEFGPATAGAGCVAVLGLSLSTMGNPHLGFFLFLAPVALVLLDAVVAIHTTRRASITATAGPPDLVVGDRFTVSLSVAGTRMPLLLSLAWGPGPHVVAADPPMSGTVDGVGRSRGVLRALGLEVVGNGLCGLVACVRRHALELARPLEIGPRPVVPAEPFPDLSGGWGEGAAVPSADGDVVRGVRAYLPGDRLRHVHWRATARLGELVVKEAKEPQAPLLHLVLDLGGGGDAGEAAAGRAAWYGCEALRRGYQLVLTTAEEGGTVTAAAPTPLTVNRRLARAGSGGPQLPGEGRRWRRVLLVTDKGDSWP